MASTQSRLLPALMIGVGLVVAAVLAQSLDLLPGFSNPVEEKEVDRSAPPLVISLEDRADLIASSGNLQVIVDREIDVRWLPGIVAGERLVYQVVGSVDGIVRLSEVESRVTVDEQTGEQIVTFTVPKPELSEVHLDLDESKVIESDSGLFNRIADFFNDNPGELQSLQRKGRDKIEAAALDAGVLEKAEDNARETLTDIAMRAGADDVVVEFVDPADDATTTTDRPST
ncbi:MAG: DUF4230 domain-containing protein [Microthrixaceae bacterium]|nr:DUF4230 domain-containing protein [Acidimicrobiales bacterium]MCB9403659.1 DUF4230 domain-containing protein [Microthrixaceae bacterium]